MASMGTLLGQQVEQFAVPIPFQEAIEFLHEAGLAVGIGFGDVLHVGADEDQAAGAAGAFADRNPGTNAGFSSFKFGLFFRQFLHKVPLFFLVQKPANIELFMITRDHEQQGIMRGFSKGIKTTEQVSRIGNQKKERAHLLVSSFARNVRANLILSMAIYHLTVKTGSRYGGQSALAKSEYIEREGKYEHRFRRYNAKAPEKGGARKSMTTRPKDWLEKTRKEWADQANQALQRVGSRERIHEGTLDQQYRDALESGDELAAKRLKDQVPGVHIGPHNVARAERGVVLERTATAQAVEDGKLGA